jgi:hypothetical protein
MGGETAVSRKKKRLDPHGRVLRRARIFALARATMSAHFFLASLAVIGHNSVRLEDI